MSRNSVKTECQLVDVARLTRINKAECQQTCPVRNNRAEVQSVTEADPLLPLTLNTFSSCLVGLCGGGRAGSGGCLRLRRVCCGLCRRCWPCCLCCVGACVRLLPFACAWLGLVRLLLARCCVLASACAPARSRPVPRFPCFSRVFGVFSGFGFLWILRGIVKKCSRTSSHGLNFFSPGFLVVSIPG